MNRIQKVFQDLKRKKKKALIIYLTAGYPSLSQTEKWLKTLPAAGADLIELGIPFSDPIADGPTIQFSSQAALKKGVSLAAILKVVRRARAQCAAPIVFMSYLNPIHRMGFKAFAQAAAAAGVDGLIVPDLIPEESKELKKALKPRGIDMIYLVAPTTPPQRRRKIAQWSDGFLYAVSVTGVTGARRQVGADTLRFVRSLKSLSKTPVAVGFGISTPDQARAFAKHADGVIIGSAVVNQIKGGRRLEPFLKSLRGALDRK